MTFATLLGDPVQLRSRQELGHYLREKTVLYPALKSARLHIQVLRHGRVLSLEVAPARYPWTQWVGQAWVELLPACVFLWAGWTPLARAPDRRPSFWFCLMCLLTACCYLASVPFRHGAFLQPHLLLLFLGGNLVSFVTGPAMLLHVTLLLPETRASRGFLALLYSLVVIVVLSWKVPVLVAVVGTLCAAVLLAVVQATWRYSASVHRQQMKWVWPRLRAGSATGSAVQRPATAAGPPPPFGRLPGGLCKTAGVLRETRKSGHISLEISDVCPLLPPHPPRHCHDCQGQSWLRPLSSYYRLLSLLGRSLSAFPRR